MISQQAAKQSHNKRPNNLTTSGQTISQQVAKQSHNKRPNDPTSGPNNLTTSGPNNLTTSGPNNLTTSGPNTLTTSGQTISQQAAKQSHNKWPNDLTSGQTISQAVAKQGNGQNRMVIGSVTCAAEKKRVGKSCGSSASFVDHEGFRHEAHSEQFIVGMPGWEPK